ncbi:MAG: IS4 family transposase [Ardenticatenaceae bacterium]|nr:IS4 family transposase [Ardenticatenaceae bacterium]MCB8943902.1 IS4 family transposase [Ardenticatenaceae bacterium]
MTKTTQKSRSTVRHTRAIQADRQKRPLVDNLTDDVEALFRSLVHPLTMMQCEVFRQMGLRERTLTLPVMMALLLSAVWRQIAAVNELVRLIRDEAILWEEPKKVSQQALAERFNTLPAILFLNVLNQFLPLMQQRWQKRERPLPPEIAWAQARFTTCLIADGSTLDALIRKVGLLRDLESHPLAGKMTALLHLGSQLPDKIWFEAKATRHDQSFWEAILAHIQAGSLLLFDLGYTNFTRFGQLTQKGVTFITRAKSNLKYEGAQVLVKTPVFRDTIVWIGAGDDRQQVRLIEVLYGNTWRRFLTNELNPEQLSARYLVALYYRRWTIERAYATIKRLLGLAYFWCGSQNAVELQLWSTWIVYTVLIDLCDEVAGLLKLPFERISVEMLFRSIYYYTKAVERGDGRPLPEYLADRSADLGIVKRKRKNEMSVFESWPLTIASNP